MALATSHIVRVTDVQTYLNQEVLNVYHYGLIVETGSTVPTMSEILSAIETAVVDEVALRQNGSVTHTELTGVNLSDGVTIGSITTNTTGSNVASGEALPSFYCVTIRLQRSSALTRHGYKRYCGISEGEVQGNDLLQNPFNSWQAVADLLRDNITIDTGVTLMPIILGTVQPALPNLNTAVYSEIIDSDVRGIGTQNTRKRGRGR